MLRSVTQAMAENFGGEKKRQWAQIQIQQQKEMQKFSVLQINLWNEGKGEKT